MTKTITKYEKRWLYAKKLADNLIKTYNDAIKYYKHNAILYDIENNIFITGELIITKSLIGIKENNSINILFEKDIEMDHGVHDTMKQIKQRFDNFVVYTPHIIKD